MRVAHFDCFSGISGDMVLGAVIDAGVPVEAIRAALDSLGLPIKLEVERVKRCGFAATKATVEAAGPGGLPVPAGCRGDHREGRLTPKQRQLATDDLPQARGGRGRGSRHAARARPFPRGRGARQHRRHRRRRGRARPARRRAFTSSPVPTGTGTVKCAHGIMPVPTPGTAGAAQGRAAGPVAVEVELTTPTGAAILTTVVSEYTATPAMTVERIGHGAGTKDFLDQPNILRLLVGTAANTRRQPPDSTETDTVVVLETNLDDVPPEIIGYCTERLFAAGALDVFVVQRQMKKSRPGVHAVGDLRAGEGRGPGSDPLPRDGDVRHPPALGRADEAAARGDHGRDAVGAGEGQARLASDGFEVITPEYEDCARVARERGIPLRDVYAAVQAKERSDPQISRMTQINSQ